MNMNMNIDIENIENYMANRQLTTEQTGILYKIILQEKLTKLDVIILCGIIQKELERINLHWDEAIKKCEEQQASGISVK